MLGKPTVMTTETLAKLRQAFLMGCCDREACLYAEIGLQTLYDYQKRNPEYSEQKRAFKTHPILKARKTVFDNLGEVKTAQWYLEKKRPKEFGLRAVKASFDNRLKSTIPKPLTKEQADDIQQLIDEQIRSINSSSSLVTLQ